MCRFKPARDGIQKPIRTLAKMHSQASMTPTGRVMGGKRGRNGRIQGGAGSIAPAVLSESSHILPKHRPFSVKEDAQRSSPLPIRVKSNTVYRTKMTLHSAKLFFKSQVEEPGRSGEAGWGQDQRFPREALQFNNSPNTAENEMLWAQQSTPSADSALPEKSTNLASNLPILVEVVVTSMASCPPPSTTCKEEKPPQCCLQHMRNNRQGRREPSLGGASHHHSTAHGSSEAPRPSPTVIVSLRLNW